MNTGISSTITIGTNANCHNFWIDSMINDSSTIIFTSGINLTLDVYGSMELAKNVNFCFIGILRFRSIKNGTETIRTAGTQFKLVQIEFDGGVNTEWLLLDSFKLMIIN